MTSEYDYETTFTFRKPNHFWEFLNKQMVIKDVDSLNDKSGGSYTKKYHLLLFSSLPTDFNDCIDSTTGCLKTSSLPSGMTQITTGYTDAQFKLGVEWLDNGENGFNLFLDEDEDVNIAIDEETVLWVKGVALAKTSGTQSGTDYIVAYAEASTRAKCQNYITLMKGTSFVGHQSCKEV